MPLAPRSLRQRILGHRTARLNPALRARPANAGRSIPVRAWPAILPALLLLAPGCNREARPLGLQDLDPGELRYVQRVVVLERAKAVALIDPAGGDVLLDSLAAAWGDSSLQDTLAGTPTQPLRAAAVGDLLSRILAAEHDSLVLAPRPDRLAAPLPDPSAAAITEQEE